MATKSRSDSQAEKFAMKWWIEVGEEMTPSERVWLGATIREILAERRAAAPVNVTLNLVLPDGDKA
jgi:hypothetical protein